MSRFPAVSIVFVAAVSAAGCASTGATPMPFPRPGASVPGPAAPAPASGTGKGGAPAAAYALGYGIAGTALSLRGAPYKNGGNDPAGFDCSGFVKYVFGQNGVAVPRTVSEQFHAGRQVPDTTQLEPGDLVFFATAGNGATHVGIAIGGDEFVHAPSSSGEVRVERMSGPYWATRFVGARRVL
jgi:cell wall-associated NlpC family hydrolase